MKNKLENILLLLTLTALFFFAIGCTNSALLYANTPTITATQSITVTMTVTPTRTPGGATPTITMTATSTPTIPVAVDNYFRTTLKETMTMTEVRRDSCGNIKYVHQNKVPLEYRELYANRNIVYNFLKVTVGKTNAEMQDYLSNRDACFQLHKFLKRKGVI